VLDAVPGQERDLVLADGADRDRRARRAVRGVQADGCGRRAEERVEAAAADDSQAFDHSASWHDDARGQFRAVGRGRPPADPAQRDRPGDRRHRRRGLAARRVPNAWWKALLALLVAVAMIIGVNYANDYSDGIRGTDDVRAGPLRLVGSKLAAPRRC
jgi:hypothetical protein